MTLTSDRPDPMMWVALDAAGEASEGGHHPPTPVQEVTASPPVQDSGPQGAPASAPKLRGLGSRPATHPEPCISASSGAHGVLPAELGQDPQSSGRNPGRPKPMGPQESCTFWGFPVHAGEWGPACRAPWPSSHQQEHQC